MDKLIAELTTKICECNSHNGSARVEIANGDGFYDIHIYSTDAKDVGIGYRVTRVLDEIFNRSVCHTRVKIGPAPISIT
jgi:hypothetical protein